MPFRLVEIILQIMFYLSITINGSIIIYIHIYIIYIIYVSFISVEPSAAPGVVRKTLGGALGGDEISRPFPVDPVDHPVEHPMGFDDILMIF